MLSSSRRGAGRSGAARRSSRSGVAVLGAIALAVLPACTSEETTPPSGGPTPAESVSPASVGEDEGRSGSSSSSTSSGHGSGETDERDGASTPTKGDTPAKREAKAAAAAGEEPDEKLHRVIRVVDGDTVEVDLNGGESIRVIGIDTPETVHPDKPTECGGPEASEAAEGILEGKSVAVVFDESQGRRDKYGRLLAYLELPGTGDFGETMLRAGHAEEYTYDTPYERQDTYRSAEEQARNAGEGVWGSCTQEQEPTQSPEPASTPTSSAPISEPSAPAPAPAAPEPAAPAPAPPATKAGPGPGWTNDTLTPGYSGCRQGYPGGKISGVYWWKPIAC